MNYLKCQSESVAGQFKSSRQFCCADADGLPHGPNKNPQPSCIPEELILHESHLLRGRRCWKLDGRTDSGFSLACVEACDKNQESGTWMAACRSLLCARTDSTAHTHHALGGVAQKKGSGPFRIETWVLISSDCDCITSEHSAQVRSVIIRMATKAEITFAVGVVVVVVVVVDCVVVVAVVVVVVIEILIAVVVVVVVVAVVQQ